MKKLMYAGLLIIFILSVSTAQAKEVRTEDQNVFNNVNTFNKGVTFKSTITGEGAIINTGALSNTGDATITGSLTVTDELVQETYTVSGASDYTVAGVNTVFYGGGAGTSAATDVVITLPPITAALDGWRIYFKNIGSGTSTTHLSACTNSVYTPTANGLLETVVGTTSGVSLLLATGNSGASVFEADYVSGGTSVWRLMNAF